DCLLCVCAAPQNMALVHYELPTNFDIMVKEVIKWSSKVKQLPSWGKHQNLVPSPEVVIKENQNPPQRSGEMFPKN
ncbi:hypothetical protein DSO57_1010863, partial [Entomophthora muscae]